MLGHCRGAMSTSRFGLFDGITIMLRKRKGWKHEQEESESAAVRNSLTCAMLDGAGYSGSSSRHRVANPPQELVDLASAVE